jgi:hypothetical protein
MVASRGEGATVHTIESAARRLTLFLAPSRAPDGQRGQAYFIAQTVVLALRLTPWPTPRLSGLVSR